jgi:predicted rRNA methylase YqxC with S4 and FtsJ domains
MYMETNLNNQEVTNLTSFTAEKARERSQMIVTETSKEQLNIILKKILKETVTGGLCCYYYDSLLPNVVTELRSRGFSVTYVNSQKDGTTYTIEW